MMETATPAAILLEANPYTVDLRLIGKWAFLFLMAGLLIFLILKIILDLRNLHYKG